MRSAIAALMSAVLLAVASYAVPPDEGRDSWPMAGVTWMITRPAPWNPACDPGTVPTYISPNTLLLIYTDENVPQPVDSVMVPQGGYVKWGYPMRPGTRARVRCRTKQTVITSFVQPDTISIYGCWSNWSMIEVPSWSTGLDSRDHVRQLSR